jgi:uncharacterized protein
MAAVVADASVLIALEQIEHVFLLEKLFGEIVIPPAVAREVGGTLPSWIITAILPSPLDPRVLAARLDPGETEVIGLALVVRFERVILDDIRARTLALSLGLPVVGTAGLLLAAKRAGHVAAVRPLLDALRAKGFRLHDDVYNAILKAAGE